MQILGVRHVVLRANETKFPGPEVTRLGEEKGGGQSFAIAIGSVAGHAVLSVELCAGLCRLGSGCRSCLFDGWLVCGCCLGVRFGRRRVLRCWFGRRICFGRFAGGIRRLLDTRIGSSRWVGSLGRATTVCRADEEGGNHHQASKRHQALSKRADVRVRPLHCSTLLYKCR